MKYIIKFKKEGKLRFISHLDLQKVFLRLFRIIGIKPKYSNGFNPHPKLSFALPLSLGFASVAEYLELETEDEKGFHIDTVNEKLKEFLPDGLSIVYIKEKPEEINKKIASHTDCAEYEIICPEFSGSNGKIKNFLDQKKITYEKVSRKTGKSKEIDIKPWILKMDQVRVNHNYITLSCILHAGTDSVLNPNVLMENFLKFSDVDIGINDLNITRKNVFCHADEKILNVDDLI